MPDKVRKTDLKGARLARIAPGHHRRRDGARLRRRGVLRKKGRGWRLVVAIADVSHYVRPGMALDKESLERGNSVYFPRRVIPMLPEKLSNGICSLNPDVERLAMVCDMDISAAGKIGKVPLYPAVFRSHARLTYNQVWSWLAGEKKPETEVASGCSAARQNLYKLFAALHKAVAKRGPSISKQPKR